MSDISAKLEAAISLSNEGIAIFDPSWNLEFCNLAWGTLHGSPCEDMQGKPVSQFFPDKHFREDVLPFLRTLEHKKEGEADLLHVDKAGNMISAWVRAAAVEDSGSSLMAYVLVSRPVGGQERALREKEENYRMFLEDASIGFFMIDLTGKLTFANKALQVMSGYSKEEFEDLSFGSLVVEEDLVKAIQDFQEVASGFPNDGTRTYRFRSKSGEIKQGEVNTLPLFVGDTIVGFHGTFVDVTQRREVLIRLQRTQKLEAIGNLAEGISNDFSKILDTVLERTQLAMDNLDPDGVAYAAVSEIVKASRRGRHLVDHLMAFSRQAGQNPRPIQVQKIVEETLSLLQGSVPDSIEVQVQMDAHCGPVFANPTEMHQVVMNLCTNAFHAMAETGGRLSIELSALHLNESEAKDYPALQPGLYANLLVRDTGTGMDEESRRRAFDPYAHPRGSGGDAGLGVAITHGIVRRCGGDIDVSSEPGKGATFSVLIPICSAEYGASDDPSELSPLMGKNERILFVEDEVSVWGLYKEMLSDLGYRVMPFTSSLDAWEAFQNWPNEFDLAVVDQSMPRMSGLELASKLLDVRPSLPVLFCASHDSSTSLEEISRTGIRHRLVKPFSSHELAAALRRMLSA